MWRGRQLSPASRQSVSSIALFQLYDPGFLPAMLLFLGSILTFKVPPPAETPVPAVENSQVAVFKA